MPSGRHLSSEALEAAKNRTLDEAIASLAAARAPEAPGRTPPVLPATSVGPAEFAHHMGLAGPAAAAAADLDGLPDLNDPRMEGYVLRGRVVPTQDIKRFILEQTAAGKGLPQIVDENKATRFPSLFTIRNWVYSDTLFGELYREAKKIRGERLGERALDVALEADELSAKSAKLKHEALSKHAARLNQEFQDKQVVESKIDPIQQLSITEAAMRLQALLQIPEVAKQIGVAGIPVILEAEKPRVAITKPYEDPLDAATPLDEGFLSGADMEEERDE